MLWVYLTGPRWKACESIEFRKPRANCGLKNKILILGFEYKTEVFGKGFHVWRTWR